MGAEADGPDRTFRTSPTATPVTCHPTLSFAATIVEVVGFVFVVVSRASVVGGEVFDTGVVDGVVAGALVVVVGDAETVVVGDPSTRSSSPAEHAEIIRTTVNSAAVLITTTAPSEGRPILLRNATSAG
jgi:hypothetical protein